MSNDARIPELVNGRVDILTADLGYTPQRAQQIDYSLQCYVSPHRLVVRTDKGLNSLADMAGKKVSFIKGSTTEGFVRASVPTASLVNFDDAPTAFLALIQGKVDAFSASDLVGARLIAKSEAKVPLKFIEQPVGREVWGIGVRKNEPMLLEAVLDLLGGDYGRAILSGTVAFASGEDCKSLRSDDPGFAARPHRRGERVGSPSGEGRLLQLLRSPIGTGPTTLAGA
jgi:Bacterial extracellular solute-binding proteins, family 3